MARATSSPPRGLERVRFELDALRMVLLHSWPLNVRELRRTVLAAVDLSDPEDDGAVIIGPRHLPAALERSAPVPVPALSDQDRELRDRLVALLARHRGNVAAVARDLGTARTRVQRLMAPFRVQRPGD